MSIEQQPPKANRFSARHVWNGHLKGLKNRDFTAGDVSPHGRSDLRARGVLWGAPTAAAGAAYVFGAEVAAVDGLVAGVGVLAGGLFMAFTQVSAWRDRLTERQDRRAASELPQRYALDETAAHILVATYASIFLLVVILVGANFADAAGALTGIFAALTIGLGSYLLLLLMIVMPRLYGGYVTNHAVDDEMSGHVH